MPTVKEILEEKDGNGSEAEPVMEKKAVVSRFRTRAGVDLLAVLEMDSDTHSKIVSAIGVAEVYPRELLTDVLTGCLELGPGSHRDAVKGLLDALRSISTPYVLLRNGDKRCQA